MNPFQQIVHQQKITALDSLPTYTPVNIDSPPQDALQFVETSPAQVPYPAAGAAAVTVISYTVPRGQRAVVTYMAIVHIGGNNPDMSGNVIWRVLINGAPHKGMGNMLAQIGSFTFPNKVRIDLGENDQLTITAEVPAAAPAPPVNMNTAARIHGWTQSII